MKALDLHIYDIISEETKKSRYYWYYTKEFAQKNKDVNKLLKIPQKKNFLGWINLSKNYAFGNEIELRFNAYDKMYNLLRQLIDTYVPINDQSNIKSMIPISPLYEISRTFWNKDPKIDILILKCINTDVFYNL